MSGKCDVAPTGNVVVCGATTRKAPAGTELKRLGHVVRNNPG